IVECSRLLHLNREQATCSLHLIRRKNCTQIVDSAGLQDVKIIGKKRVHLRKRGLLTANISPKSTVKSVHELSAVIYDLSTTITAFKSWIPSRVCLRFKCSSTSGPTLQTCSSDASNKLDCRLTIRRTRSERPGSRIFWKMTALLKPLSESLAMESCFLCVGSEMKGGLRSESRHRGGEGCIFSRNGRREKLMRDLSFRSQYLMH